jgi:hypothetical protein
MLTGVRCSSPASNVSIGFCNGGGGGPTWFNQGTPTTWLQFGSNVTTATFTGQNIGTTLSKW